MASDLTRVRVHDDGRVALYFPSRLLGTNWLIVETCTETWQAVPQLAVLTPGWRDAVIVPSDVNRAGSSPFDIAGQAIGLFLEYRDQHDLPEDEAAACAAREIAEGCATDLTAEAVTTDG